MKKKSLRIIFLSLAGFIGTVFAGAQGLETGVVIEKIVCSENPQQTYALYLPSNYSERENWPILYAFDPAARGTLAVESFQDAAEKYGYIIAGSNNARNGPWNPIFQAMAAVWNDTHDRLPLDEKRVYAAGFSGGARAASLLSQVVFKPVTGVIACGAGLAANIKPEDMKHTVFMGVVGTRDFNYMELIQLEKNFREMDIPHRLLVFDGPHIWPPKDICLRALEWMHLIGMKEKIIPESPDFIKGVLLKELEEAENKADAGFLSWALSEYRTILSVFQTRKEVEEIEERIDRLQESEAYKKFLIEEEIRQQYELLRLAKNRSVFQAIENVSSSQLDVEKILSELDADQLLKKAGQNSSIPDQNLGFRLLYDITLSAYRRGWTSLQEKDNAKALACFKVATHSTEHFPEYRNAAHYGLACVQASKKNTEEAIANLKLAVRYGFSDAEELEKSPYLESIRESPEFLRILKSLK